MSKGLCTIPPEKKISKTLGDMCLLSSIYLGGVHLLWSAWPELCWCSFISQTFPLWRAAVLTDTRVLRLLLVTPRPQITSHSCRRREVRSAWHCLSSSVLRCAGFYFCVSVTCACFAFWSAVRCRSEFSGVNPPVFCSWICFPKLRFPLYLSVCLSYWTLGT